MELVGLMGHSRILWLDNRRVLLDRSRWTGGDGMVFLVCLCFAVARDDASQHDTMVMTIPF